MNGFIPVALTGSHSRFASVQQAAGAESTLCMKSLCRHGEYTTFLHCLPHGAVDISSLSQVALCSTL